MTAGGGGIHEYYLKPGEVVIADSASIVSTVLGSCISVTMFNRQYAVGGICHSLLPACRDREDCPGACSELYRYVECTIKRMMQDFIGCRIEPHKIEIKLFGGSDMFSVCGLKNNVLSVGKKNVETAFRTLDDFGLKPSISDTGGSLGRKIIFHTHTGQVYLKRLNKAEIGKCCNG